MPLCRSGVKATFMLQARWSAGLGPNGPPPATVGPVVPEPAVSGEGDRFGTFGPKVRDRTALHRSQRGAISWLQEEGRQAMPAATTTTPPNRNRRIRRLGI